MTSPAAVFAYCRAGFEAEAGLDLARIAARAAIRLDVEAHPGAACVVARSPHVDVAAWDRACAAAPPVFARAIAIGGDAVALTAAPAAGARVDRVTPLVAAIETLAQQRSHAPPWRSVWLEYPDTNEGKALSPLARALAPRVEGELRARRALDERAPRRLRVFLADGQRAFVGTALAEHGDWPLGIPRLRMPRGAPSRSTLKLAEAFAAFLGDDETRLLRAGQRAVDLGAAPGGWTWQLVQRGLRVTAVDNGRLRGEVAGDPLVTHVRDDGLHWRPRRPVDWLVCDIVEQPLRIADLVAAWIADGAARRAIFNLKLPMKKRYDEVQRCEQRMAAVLRPTGAHWTLRLRQLYHDREEVTGYLARDRN
ncbi:MAG: 23S rRNA (cytidine(2498)-2'-O)-methyltransferase RlmM [Betaproteobacteria bacterium]|nr:23S rRNA (cytidine(2498)-2'-O)-methyltransferase RlmM [Betaproteobacteria bacterium]